MNPRLMLSLWRERWGKAAGTTSKVPYLHAKVNQWTDGLPYARIWSVMGVSAVGLFVCILLICFMMSVSFSFGGQIVFSVFFVCVAAYLRRYAGMLITLTLVGMAIIASTRYLYWRFDATLIPSFSLDFLFGFCFFVAECCLAWLVFTGLVQSIWPLKRALAALPGVQEEWPCVDVFILCDDQPYAATKSTAMAIHKLDWPRKKLKMFLIDGMQRDDLHILATSIGAHYLPHRDESGGHAGFINQSLPLSTGEFIVVFESGQVPGQQFLQSTVGWFLRDSKLAIVLTPHHFLAPIPSQHALEIVHPTGSAVSCVLMRRSIIVQMGGIDARAVTQTSHMALVLQAAGYTSAYMGFNGRETGPEKNRFHNVMAEPTAYASTEIFLVEHPFAIRSLRWRQHVASFHSALNFYYPAARLLFFITPVVYLLGHIQAVQASPQLWMVYLIPHFVHAHIARTRTDEKARFKLFADIRETILAWYMLIPATLTLLRTELKQLLTPWISNKSNPVGKSYRSSDVKPTRLFSPAILLSYLLALSLNLTGLLGGLTDMIFSSVSQRETTAMYLLWTTYNLMLLAAMLAVAKEARQVLMHTQLKLYLPAMIKLPSGRTVSCTTQNFPASVLELSLPIAVALDTGAPVSLSIFHAHQELVFPAVVTAREGSKLGVRIIDTAQKDYQLFTTAVLSRGPNWPKWLPGYRADHPLPKWVTATFASVLIATLDFVTNINKYLHWVRLDSWIKLWKKRND